MAESLRIVATAVVLLAGEGQLSLAHAAEPTNVPRIVRFAIKPEPLALALNDLALQSHQRIAFTPDMVKDFAAPGISGDLTLDDALRALLGNTGLSATRSADGVILIIRRDSQGSANEPPSLTPSTPRTLPGTTNDTDNNERRAELNNDKPERRGFWSRIINLFGDSKDTNKANGKGSYKLAQVVALCGSASLAGIACGQTAPAAPGDAQLDEIVVTAQKRSESLEKTALAVTALTGSSLSALGIQNAQDLTQVVPNLEVGANGTGAQVAIRGVVSTNITEVGDPAVAFNVDGIYLARQRSALTSLYDVDHIEVLRGPQGTLYGRNSIAGAINVITNKPDLTSQSAEGYIQYGNYNEIQTGAVLNLPVVDTFGLRMAFQSERHDGYSNNAPARNYNDLDAISARVEGLYRPNDDFSALLILDHFHNGGAGGGGYVGGAPLGIYAVSAGATPYNYAEPANPSFLDELAQGVSLTLSYKLPFATVTYVGGYRTDNFAADGTIALQGPIVNSFGGNCPTLTSASCFQTPNSSKEYQLSNELRLSNDNDYVSWVVGLYYFKEHNNVFNGLNPCPCSLFDLAFVEPEVLELTRAVFAQATWKATDRLRFTGGVRYNDDFKGRDGADEMGPLGSIVGFSCVGCTDYEPDYARETFKKTTWKVGVDFDLAPGSLLFGTIATGYKDGGYSDGLPPDNNPYLPEEIKNYEIGWKNDLLNHRLTANIDAFHAKYTNYQSTAGENINGVIAALTVNAGAAEIDGVEIETAMLVTPLDRVEFNATWLHAYFNDFYLPLGDGFDNFQPESLTGRNLPNAPRDTFRLAYQHTFPLANGSSIVPHIDSSYVGAQDLDYHNFAVTHQGSYTRTDLSLTFAASKTWSTMLYVRNLENTAVLASAQADNSVPAQYIGLAGKAGFYLAPRTYGIRLSAKF